MTVPSKDETIRFSVLNRLLHLVVMIGFSGLALTGFSLKFSAQTWAQVVAWLLWGAPGLRSLHRIFAVLTYCCVVAHLSWLLYYKCVLKGRITGPDTLFPRLRDLKDLANHMRYMFGKGPSPAFERFSYWEKFDYWAILIGMNTMGLTGVVLWFPEFFTRLVPGYLVNVAYVLHLYEAILAVSLKFVVHIITTHLRPEVFPLDRSIFNGRARHPRGRTAAVIFLCLGFIWGLRAEALAQRSSLMNMTEDGGLRPCLDCHRLPNVNTNEGAASSQVFCLECHSNNSCKREDGTSLVVRLESFGKGRHRYQACITCHADVARSPHISDSGAVCTSCHFYHDYSQAGDPHIRVQCQACHRKSPFVEFDRRKDMVVLAKKDLNAAGLSLADHSMGDAGSIETCRRCHKPGTSIGAASAILPGQNFLCIACHGASAAPGHWSFLVSLLVLIAGFTGTAILWLRGRVGDEAHSVHRKISIIGEELWGAIFSRRFAGLLSAFFYDVLLQRRLLKESVLRWCSHSLIYYGFLGKFFLALAAVISRAFSQGGTIAYALLDKNNWMNALLNDIFGLLIVLGILIAVVQRLVWRPTHVLSEGQDSLALIIIGVVAAGGFILEGARILVTELTAEKAVYSFVGYGAALVLRSMAEDWRGIYGVLWWIHSAAWAVFLAYLPFGKLKHIVITPLSLLLREGVRGETR